MWGATRVKGQCNKPFKNFNPRTPCGVRLRLAQYPFFPLDFNPRTPCGVRLALLGKFGHLLDDFNPRTPCGVRLKRGGFVGLLCLFQSTHPVWGATHLLDRNTFTFQDFNPRTPCGVRLVKPLAIPEATLISIHAPRVGCDAQQKMRMSSFRRFQSTHPVWGATIRSIITLFWLFNFNPRTPCGVRHSFEFPGISVSLFQSTHPVWGATSI